MIGAKRYFGISLLASSVNELHAHKLTFIMAKKVYGKENQLLSSVEELNELSAELLKCRKRTSGLDSVAGEVADVIIQLAVIFENNPGLTELVKHRIPEKMAKCETKIMEYLKEQRSSQSVQECDATAAQ